MKWSKMDKIWQAWHVFPTPEDPNIWDMLRISQVRGEKIELWWTRFILFSIYSVILFFLLKLFKVTFVNIIDILEITAIGLIIIILYKR